MRSITCNGLRVKLLAAQDLFVDLSTINSALAPLRTAVYLSLHPMAQCVVHALKGLACREPVLTHAEVTNNI